MCIRDRDYLPPRRAADNGEETFQAGAGDFDLNGATAETGGFDLSNAPATAGGFDLGPGVAQQSPAPSPSGGGFEMGPAATESAPDVQSGGFDLNTPTAPVAEKATAETPAPAPVTAEAASTETAPATPETPTADSSAVAPTETNTTAADSNSSDVTSSEGEAKPDAEAAAGDAAAGDTPAGDAAATSAQPNLGDDVDLLSVALNEEKEFSALRKKRRREKREKRGITGIVVFCPRGHRIEVPIRFAGKRGKCPKCKSAFSVPRPSKDEREKAEEAANVVKEPTVPWLWDVQIHELDPVSLKLKVGSMKTAANEADLFLDESGIRIGTLIVDKKGKKLKVSAKKKDPVRESIREHLVADLALKDLPVGDNELLKADDIGKLVIVQPTNAPEDSIFAGIPVFGEGRIAVRLTSGADGKQRFFSFELARFRQFSKQLSKLYGIENFGQDVGIPLKEEFETAKCHYTNDTVESLKDLEFYQQDSSYELKLVGRKCELCNLVVSEEARKKEKLGGASGRGIAKAKCPKCNGKFGKISLYSMDVNAEETSNDEAATSEAVTDKVVAGEVEEQATTPAAVPEVPDTSS